ncbi:MAG: bifunctional riboflavin kinase/FAD synthetase [Niastella sp.]|nr:bifunctional riboflavin kinase/FAD synthetase [Niastella sp.]
MSLHIYRSVTELPAFKNAIITIGTFDGVHLGHTFIIEKMITRAKKVGGTPVLITFYPHPKQVLPGTKNKLYTLTTQQEKFDLLHSKGINHIVEVAFTSEFANQSPEKYIRDFLVKNFHPHTIIIGYDHRYGKGRQGDFKLLEKMAPQFNFEVIEINEKIIEQVTISSTKIRDALLDGDLKTAEEYLGYPYSFTGTVITGNKLGRTIGYPTANIKIGDEDKLIPQNGVYAVDAILNGDDFTEKTLKGMMNIGLRPTVQGTQRTIEVNLFAFDKEIYGSSITIILKYRLREEIKFDGLDSLKIQLAKDKKAAQKFNP